MTVDEIIEKVEQVLVAEFELDPAQIRPEARLQEDLDLDSLDGVDLGLALEKAFGIRLKEAKAMAQMRTVGDIHDFIRAHYGG